MDLDLHLVADGLAVSRRARRHGGRLGDPGGDRSAAPDHPRRPRRDAATIVAEPGGGPNGAGDRAGRGALRLQQRRPLHLARGGRRHHPGAAAGGARGGSIQRMDLATGAVTTLYEQCDGRRLLAPNDLVFDRRRRLLVHRPRHGGDHDGPRHGGICWARPDGSKIVRAATLPTPNGVGLSPGRQGGLCRRHHERAAVGVRHRRARARSRPARWPPCPGRVVVTMPGYQLFDSLAMEADGRVCVATLINGGISAITPEGEVGAIRRPRPAPHQHRLRRRRHARRLDHGVGHGQALQDAVGPGRA